MADFYSLSPEQQQAILDGPAGPPPDDSIEPNFINPLSQNTAPRVILGFCFAVNTILVVARVYGRCIVLKKPGLADYLIVPTYNYLNSTILYAVILALIKVAILVEWLQIFIPKGTRNLFFWCAHVLLWVNARFYLSAIVVIIVSYVPQENDWNKLLRGIDDIPLDIASSAVNFLIDISILLLPERVIWRLNMSSKNKAGVLAIFGLGVLAVVAAGYHTGLIISKRHSVDTTWNHSLVSILLTVEITCGFVVVCLPACPKAVQAARMSNFYSKIKSVLTGWSLYTSTSHDSQRHGSSHSWPRSRDKASDSITPQYTPRKAYVPLEPRGSNKALRKDHMDKSEQY
ncbi:hypothetical protein F4823DRAFT_633807 [Ustulina deusta]|nr:hypothetical protein F4823DRAFT_633807 [Ustulina deusta]